MPQLDTDDLKKELRKEGLRYISDTKPGFMRQKIKPEFYYYDTEGKRIRDKDVIGRIETLAIPPAWKNVWICPSENGYLQATGLDDRGRKQYVYHPDWTKATQENKFERLVDFGLALPIVRGKIDYELHQKDLDKERILATVVWLLEKTFIRIGNEEYAKDNESFGLTTLRNRHAKVRGNEVVFKFRGKSGVENIIEVTNPTIAKTIRKCIELPGYELFQFIDDSGNRHVIDSADVNEFLKEVTKNEFSAKDFRTWGATNLSARNLYRLGESEDEKNLKQNIVQTIKEVAQHLNNTVSVCRNYYIHPQVIKSYAKKILVPHFAKFERTRKSIKGLSWNETALISLLQKFN
ncbi:MAG: DNA topoisomerase IB [Candidatus Levybacteria bacterium]|nr:DNA topoisomerase IB [Candidatus Levybacteria bacterium]